MNERLLALAVMAGFENGHQDRNGNSLSGELEKFAELIVRECAQLARDTDLEDVEGGDSEVLRAAKRQILEHFGVEE